MDAQLYSLRTGNLWGLQERVVAVGSLEALAAQLRQCRAPLQALLAQAQYAAQDAFYARSVDATREYPARCTPFFDIPDLSTRQCMHP